jgi:hypothetical protein
MSVRDRNWLNLLGPRHGRIPVIEDPRHFIAERAMRDERILDVVHMLDKAAMDYALRDTQAGWKPMIAADGIFYRDTRQPLLIASQTPITLAATDKLLYPGALTAIPANYLWPGKKLKLTVYGAFTTALTPGNLGVELYYGTSDAGGTLLGSSASPALTASRTSMSVIIEAYLRAQAAGSAAAMFAWAKSVFGGASTNDLLATPHIFTPAAVPATVNVDTTAASGFNAQIKRSGSTVETFTTWDLIFEALN